jgi:hypothetical protein
MMIRRRLALSMRRTSYIRLILFFEGFASITLFGYEQVTPNRD